MVRIPDQNAIADHRWQDTRKIENYDASSAAAPGRAQEALGRSIASVGESLGGLLSAAGTRDAERDKYETLTKFLDFDLKQNDKFKEAQRNIHPEGDGFRESITKSYDEAARAFFKNEVPDHLKGEYDYKLRQRGIDYERSARDFELKKRDDFHEKSITEGIAGELSMVDKDPDSLRDAVGRGISRIEASRLPSNRKEEMKQKFASEAEKRHIEGRLQRGDDPDQVLKDIRTYPTRPPAGVRYDDGAPVGGSGPVEKDPKAYLRSKLAPGYEKRTSDVDNLNPVMVDRLAALTAAAQEAGHDVRIISGHRDAARQAVLWENALKKYGSADEARRHVAPPGGSSHQSGEAVDLQYGDRGAGLGGKRTAAVDWVHANAKRFGLAFPLSHEDWHIEPIEAREGGKRYGGNYDTTKTYWQGGRIAGGAQAPGSAAGDITPKLSAYSPQRPGSGIGEMEGGYAAARPGPDGKAEVRTLDDVATGRSKYVTLAGNPNQYGKTYTIPEITFVGPDGKEQTLKNVQGVVHDTGGRFKTAAADRFDVPVARDIDDKTMARQPFLKSGVKFIPSTGKPSDVAESTPLAQRGLTTFAGHPTSGKEVKVADASGSVPEGVVSEITGKGQISTILDGIPDDQPLSTVPPDVRERLMAILPKDAEKQISMPDGTKATAMDAVTVGQVKEAFSAPAEQARETAVAGSIQRDDNGDGEPDLTPGYSDNAPYRWLSARDRKLMAGKAIIAQRNMMIKAGEDEAKRIEHTGQGKVYDDGSTYLEKAQRVLTRNQFEKQKARIDAAQWRYEMVNPIPNLSESELSSHMDRMAEKITESKDDDGYQARVRAYDAAVKAADTIRTLRRDDAAASVARTPEVLGVIEQIKKAKSNTATIGTGPGGKPLVSTEERVDMTPGDAREALIEARLQAQERIFGDPRDPRIKIITKAEAEQLLRITKASEMGEADLEAALKEGAARADKAYGQYARRAFDEAVKILIHNKAGREEASGIAQRVIRGEPLTTMDMHRYKLVGELSPVDSFLQKSAPRSLDGASFNSSYDGLRPGRGAPAVSRDDSRPAIADTAPTVSSGNPQSVTMRVPTPDDAAWLMQNPVKRAAAIDKAFGAGSSQRIIEFWQKNGGAMGAAKRSSAPPTSFESLFGFGLSNR